jgi:hypothetical protein
VFDLPCGELSFERLPFCFVFYLLRILVVIGPDCIKFFSLGENWGIPGEFRALGFVLVSVPSNLMLSKMLYYDLFLSSGRISVSVIDLRLSFSDE